MKLTALTAIIAGMTMVSGAAYADGKQAFLDANCSQCHSVTSEGIAAANMNLELDGIGDRKDAASIEAYMRSGSPHPLSWTGSDADLTAVAEWLASK